MTQKKISLFVPCFVDQIWPSAGIATMRVLERLGYSVEYPEGQSCCAQPAYNAGYVNAARRVMEYTASIFAQSPAPVVMPSASCVGFMRTYYPREGCKAPAVYELVEFLMRFEKESIARIGASFPYVVTYHDSCSALREIKLREGVRYILSQVRGLQLREMQDTDRCCGFGGTFAVKFPSISTAMARYKLQKALDTSATHVVSTDVSCLMHLRAYAQAHHLPLRFLHIAEVLNSYE